MNYKIVNWLLVDIQGRNPRTVDMLLMYGTGLLFAGLLVWYGTAQKWELLWWQYLVLFVLAFDIVGGVVANATKATNEVYKPKKKRIIAAVIHFIQPLVLTEYFTHDWALFWFLYLYMLVASFMVIYADKNTAAPLALSLVFLGLGLLHLVFVFEIPAYALWFAPAFFAKLIFSSSVAHCAA